MENDFSKIERANKYTKDYMKRMKMPNKYDNDNLNDIARLRSFALYQLQISNILGEKRSCDDLFTSILYIDI